MNNSVLNYLNNKIIFNAFKNLINVNKDYLIIIIRIIQFI